MGRNWNEIRENKGKQLTMTICRSSWKCGSLSAVWKQCRETWDYSWDICKSLHVIFWSLLNWNLFLWLELPCSMVYVSQPYPYPPNVQSRGKLNLLLWYLYPFLTLNLGFWFETTLIRSVDEQGNCEAFHRSCGCCGLCVEDEVQREHCESVCDFATHVLFHTCALCQEGRELRRRIPHPGFNARPVLVMIPPTEQNMGRGVWDPHRASSLMFCYSGWCLSAESAWNYISEKKIYSDEVLYEWDGMSYLWIIYCSFMHRICMLKRLVRMNVSICMFLLSFELINLKLYFMAKCFILF